MDRNAQEELVMFVDGFECLGDFTDRGMTKLLSGLGYDDVPDHFDWSDRVAAAADAGAVRLVRRLEHRDPEIRAAVTQVLEWCWADAAALILHLQLRLRTEPNRQVRLGAILAVARLTSVLPAGDRSRRAAEAWLSETVTTPSTPLDRFAGALGLVQFIQRPAPDELVDVLATTLSIGNEPCQKVIGEAVHWVVSEALEGQTAARLRFVLRVLAQPWSPRGFRAMSSSVMAECFDARTRADVDAEQAVELMRAMGAIAADLSKDSEIRWWAARSLELPPGEARPVADELAVAVKAEDLTLRRTAMMALARIGDARAVPALLELIEAGDGDYRGLPEAFGPMRAHAAELLPAIVRRLERVPPAKIEFLDGGLYRQHGGLNGFEEHLIRSLVEWGDAAAVVAPQLDRIRADYQAEQERYADRLPDLFSHGALPLVERALGRIDPAKRHRLT